LQVEVDPLNAVSSIFPGVSDSATQMPVDTAFIELTIEEQEELLDLILIQIYKLPLINEHLILGKIVDNYTIVAVLAYSFQGVGLSALLGGDVGNYSSTLQTEANYLLACLTAGRNLTMPMPVAAIGNRFMAGLAPKTLVLPGEVLQDSVPTIISSTHTLMGTRNYTTPEELGVSFDSDFVYTPKDRNTYFYE
jgi:hypothetical protein